MSRLILKTWKKGEDQKHKIYTDMREAIAKQRPEEEFYIIHKIKEVEKLRKTLDTPH